MLQMSGIAARVMDDSTNSHELTEMTFNGTEDDSNVTGGRC